MSHRRRREGEKQRKNPVDEDMMEFLRFFKSLSPEMREDFLVNNMMADVAEILERYHLDPEAIIDPFIRLTLFLLFEIASGITEGDLDFLIERVRLQFRELIAHGRLVEDPENPGMYVFPDNVEELLEKELRGRYSVD